MAARDFCDAVGGILDAQGVLLLGSGLAFSEGEPGSSFLQTQQNLASGGFQGEAGWTIAPNRLSTLFPERSENGSTPRQVPINLK
jgi:hypothetical protein